MFDKVDVNIGNQFKQQRIAKHYSMQYMADRLGLPKSSYYYYGIAIPFFRGRIRGHTL